MSGSLSRRIVITDPSRRNTYYIETRRQWRHIERKSEAVKYRKRGENLYDYSQK